MMLLMSLTSLYTAESFPCLKLILIFSQLRFLCREYLPGEEASERGCMTEFLLLCEAVSELETPSFRESGTKGPDAALPLISSMTWDKSLSLFSFRVSIFIIWKHTTTALRGKIYKDKLSKRCEIYKQMGGYLSFWVSLPVDHVQILPKVLTENQDAN